jgi:hypothetical protein
MSSPKRAAKTKTVAKPAVKRAAKSAKPAGRRTSAARPARSGGAATNVVATNVANAVSGNGAATDAKRLAAAFDRILADGELDALPADALQTLIASACRLYRARREAGEEFPPVPKNSISATDAMVTASGLLKALDLAVFELGMWQNWTGR